MYIIIVGILILVVYIINKISVNSSNPQKSIYKFLLITGLVCLIIDEFCKGLGAIIFILVFVGFLWFKLYDN